METKEIRITVPEGMEIDKENSTFECIKFKPKSLTYYKDVQKDFLPYTKCVNCNQKHIKKLEVYLKLLEVAEYLNDGWKPNWNTNLQIKYIIALDYTSDEFNIINRAYVDMGLPAFKSEELAQQAIQIIGEDNLKILFEA